ncbi:MAG TPA: HAMP domain-containing sensor histidine kinase [Longimicrobiaceae bacterium]
MNAALLAAAGLAATALAAAAVRWLAERRAGRLRREFAQGVSHELRTPLALVRMFAEMLVVHRDGPAEERERWAETVGREALRLDGMLANLLDFAHGGEAVSPVRAPADLGALLEDVAADCAPLAAARGSWIHADPPAGVVARVDAAALRRAVANLLDNAVRHGAPGQTVTLTLGVQGGRAEVAVEDQGAGVAARDRARIWEPFARAGEAGGMGLGLAAVRRVAAAHGGSARVEDAPGGGARFVLALPLEPAARGAPAAAALPG